ncbi:MAG TPA: twin-arginine translocation signal domain-containing protein, partial [Acidobacteriaceae bacterium]|nr:twin-arginine translocation signal domain-containing protein [Acidobacteriaceae bacterium]
MKKKSGSSPNAPMEETAAHDPSEILGKFSRRSFLTQLGAAGIAATAVPIAHAAGVDQAVAPEAQMAEHAPGAVPVTLRVNGQTHKLMLEPRVTLLDAIRDNLKM